MLNTKTKIREEAAMKMSNIRKNMQAINREFNKKRWTDVAYVHEKANKIAFDSNQLVKLAKLMSDLDG